MVRSFRKTSQNTFEHININDLKQYDEDVTLESNNRKIRPTIYKTFLKVKSLENNNKVSDYISFGLSQKYNVEFYN